MVCMQLVEIRVSYYVVMPLSSGFLLSTKKRVGQNISLLMLMMPWALQVCVGALLGVLVGVFFPIPAAVAVA